MNVSAPTAWPLQGDALPYEPRTAALRKRLALVWVILVYTIVSTILVLTAGRLSDIFGRKRREAA